MIALNTALQGMQQAESSFDAAARRIAGPSATPPGDTASLSENAVALLQSKSDFQANVKTAHVADEMTRATLNMLA
jgi:hypothetical protein